MTDLSRRTSAEGAEGSQEQGAALGLADDAATRSIRPRLHTWLWSGIQAALSSRGRATGQGAWPKRALAGSSRSTNSGRSRSHDLRECSVCHEDVTEQVHRATYEGGIFGVPSRRRRPKPCPNDVVVTCAAGHQAKYAPVTDADRRPERIEWLERELGIGPTATDPPAPERR